MKNQTILPFLLTLMLLSPGFLVACGTNEPIQEDALSELEAIADANGDIEISLDIRITPDSSQLSVAYYQYKLTNFQSTTPKGKNLEGIILLPEGFEEVKVTFQNAKLRGRVTKLSGEKIFSGFVVSDNSGLGIVPLLAYKEGTSFKAADSGSTSLQISADLARRNDDVSAMVARNENGVILSLIASEDLSLQENLRQQPGQLEIEQTATYGFFTQGEAAITLDNGIKFRSVFAALLGCSRTSGLQECTISK